MQNETDLKKVRRKLGLTVGTKLIGVIALLLLVSLSSVVWLATDLFTEDTTGLINQMNIDTAAALASRTRDQVDALNRKTKLMGALLQQGSSQIETHRALQKSFEADPDLLGVYLYEWKNSEYALTQKAISPLLSQMGDETGTKTLAHLNSNRLYSLQTVSRGEISVVSFLLPDQTVAFAISSPFIKQGETFTHLLTTIVKHQAVAKAFTDERGAVNPYLVDRTGRILAHVNPTYAKARENFSTVPIVTKMLQGKTTNDTGEYKDPRSKKRMLGAFRLVGVSGLGVVSEVEKERATEVVRRVQVRSSLAGITVLFLAFLIGYFFSGSLTRPIRELMRASHRVSEGDFKIALKPKGDDEIAHLSIAFNEMAQGLEERDRVKDVFNKFHNKEIAEKLLSGDVKLGGERREAVIFFSDVRGFTAMSESMQPEEVVEMLNEYMTRMVAVIRSHGGIVDKYVGDAIMALWGIPLGAPDDPERAVRACLEMRKELAKLNELRLSRGQNVLKIGMGLNIGSVIAGNIGSTEKMEYTVIGDSVNLASRIESMTKEYGADLLISKSIADRVQGQFVLVPCKAAKVKGKSLAIEIFKVKGLISQTGETTLIETPYSEYESEKSDKAVHDESHNLPSTSTPTPTPVSPAETTGFLLEISDTAELGDGADLTDPSISIDLNALKSEHKKNAA